MDEVLSQAELDALFEAMSRPVEPTAPLAPAPAPLALERVAQVPLTATVEVGRVRVSLARLLALRPGDALPLDRPMATRLPLVVAGRTVAWGQPVLHGEHLALRIDGG